MIKKNSQKGKGNILIEKKINDMLKNQNILNNLPNYKDLLAEYLYITTNYDNRFIENKNKFITTNKRTLPNINKKKINDKKELKNIGINTDNKNISSRGTSTKLDKFIKSSFKKNKKKINSIENILNKNRRNAFNNIKNIINEEEKEITTKK